MWNKLKTNKIMENSTEGAFATSNEQDYQKGLTKREYFAGLAMKSIIESTVTNEITLWQRIKILFGLKHTITHSFNSLRISESALILADELLKQLEK